MATDNSFKSYAGKLEDTLEEYLVKKAPVLPDNAKDAIVRFLPWIIIVLMALSLPVILALIGLGTVLAPAAFLSGVSYGVSQIVFQILTLVAVVLEGLAIPGLLKKEMRGWRLLYWSTLVSVIGGVFGGNLLGGIIFGLISLYILFQIRSKYR
jgi:hypothetical protein